MQKFSKTKYHSWKKGRLAKGCRLCVRGQKLVLFVTGICGQKCFFCPISDEKAGKDVVYANEWKDASAKEIIKEAELCDAKGAGITGGDPLARLDRTCNYIRMLKKRFGKKFHIHLYTPLLLVDEKKLRALYEAGLDEIRFHPALDKKDEWPRILLAKKYEWDVGVEIPVIPGKKKETIELLDFVKDKVDFINLNELEISDTNASRLVERGFKTKDELSYGVRGSHELAMQLLKHLAKSKASVHYCTAKLKDSVQMRQRIKRRAKNVAKPYDIITKNGTLVRGAIYLKKICPGLDYRRKLGFANKKAIIADLKKLQKKLRFKTDVDEHKLRLITSAVNACKYAKDLKQKHLIPAVVEEYPTWDAIELDVVFV